MNSGPIPPISDKAEKLFLESPDDSIIDLAHIVDQLHGPSQAAHVLQKANGPQRTDNYKFALGHFLVMSNDMKQADSTMMGASISDCKNAAYIASNVRMLISLERYQEAFANVRACIDDICGHSQASMDVLKSIVIHARDPEILDPIFKALERRCAELPQNDSIKLAFWSVLAYGETGLAMNFRSTSLAAEEIARYTMDNDLACSLRVANELLASDRFCGEQDVLSLIRDSIASKKGFSLIRIGDGEGRFLPPLDQYPSLQTIANDVAKRIWFWNSRTAPDSSFFKWLQDAVLFADVVGFSPPFRVSFATEDYIGYLGVTQGNRFVRQTIASSSYRVSYNWINVLINHALLQDIIPNTARVTVISPHKNVNLLNKFGEARLRHIVIPSENHPLVIGQSITAPHFPDVFETVLAKIRSDPEGLFLVAGGVFGKIYCHEIKKAGGVALDMGSVADQWVGLQTR